jgi:hypothetical protein
MDTPRYPPALAELLALPSAMPLDAGTPDRSAADRLRRLDAAGLFAPAAVRDADMARACLAGLWLRCNCLDESHRISQEVPTPEGSFWHGIMHRREGDYGNAKYWFRRVGRHPVFDPLAAEAKKLMALSAETWDPFAFVDLVEGQVVRQRGDVEALLALQQREWELLFEYCYERAVGA